MPQLLQINSTKPPKPETVSLADFAHTLIKIIGEDPNRPGLKKTPQRFARVITELTSGYAADIDKIVNEAIYPHRGNSDLVLVRDIPFSSLCEHHLLPFTGKAHIAYIPKNKIIGLSKIPRIVDMFARRLQLQEQLTFQIADTLEKKLSPVGVGVIIEARHQCLEMRGAKSRGSKMVTSSYRGKMRNCATTRCEFLSLLR